MNKKGFTLIEVLAVIGILAVITVIATPTVIKIYNNAKASAHKAEVRSIAKAAEGYYVANKKNTSVNTKFNGKTNLIKNIPLIGEKPTGTITITKKGAVTLKVVIDGYEYTYTTDDEDVGMRKLTEEELAASTQGRPYEFFIDENTPSSSFQGVPFYKISRDDEFFTMDDLVGGHYTFAVTMTDEEDGLCQMINYSADLTENSVDVTMGGIGMARSAGGEIEDETQQMSLSYGAIFQVQEQSVGSGINNMRMIYFQLGVVLVLEDMDAVNYYNTQIGGNVFESTGSYYIIADDLSGGMGNPKLRLYWNYSEPYDIESDSNFGRAYCTNFINEGA